MPKVWPLAIDISNYTGELGTAETDWIKGTADLVIVRLSTEDGGNQRAIAAQQVEALASAGIPWQGYLWCYWDEDPYTHWRRAQELLPAGWPGYHKLGIWLDCEDDANPRTMPLHWVALYALALRADGFVPGIYTGGWWIERHRAAFSGDRAPYWPTMPLWAANYSVAPGNPVPGIAPWEGVAMHQYTEVRQGPVMHSYDLSVIDHTV